MIDFTKNKAIVGPYSYTVDTTHSAIDALRRALEDPNLVGHISYHERRIVLAPTQNTNNLVVAFWHELLHACMDLAGFKDEDYAETVVTRLAPILVDTLRRNPWLRLSEGE